jgi:4-hydroxyphenylpyruvate dioxygenase
MATITTEWKGTEHFPILDFHHVEFYVGNAKQAAHFYRSVLGFQPLAYCGPETGQRGFVSYVLKQNHIRFVFTTPLSSRHPAAEWLKRHGDGVRDTAFEVADSASAHASCLSRGAVSAYSPTETSDENGTYRAAGIQTYGETIHSLVDSSEYSGAWAPGYVALEVPGIAGRFPNLQYIDHVVGNVEQNRMNNWMDFYQRVFGFANFVAFDEGDISTKYSSLKSRVMRSKNWKIKLPINEPARGLRKSQIEEFLQYCEGPGVQHIALGTGDIIKSVDSLKAKGLEFLSVPDAYYETLSARVGRIEEDLSAIRRLGILVDKDEEGYLLQIFTKPLEDRPTLFLEIIQRKGSRGFGQNNFQALFESLEIEQARRGNLVPAGPKAGEACPFM